MFPRQHDAVGIVQKVDSAQTVPGTVAPTKVGDADGLDLALAHQGNGDVRFC